LGEIVKYVPYVGNYITKLRAPEIVWLPSVMNYMVNVVTGMVMVPVVRTATYKINDNIKVIVEQNDLLSCMKIGDVFELAKTSNKTIAYNYDAYKIDKNTTLVKDVFVCDLGKGKKNGFIKIPSNDEKQDCTNELIVHYPKENDAVGQMIGSFNNCVKDPINCSLTIIDNVATGVQSVINYGKDIVNPIIYSPFYSSLATLLIAEFLHKAIDHHLPGTMAKIDIDTVAE